MWQWLRALRAIATTCLFFRAKSLWHNDTDGRLYDLTSYRPLAAWLIAAPRVVPWRLADVTARMRAAGLASSDGEALEYRIKIAAFRRVFRTLLGELARAAACPRLPRRSPMPSERNRCASARRRWVHSDEG